MVPSDRELCARRVPEDGPGGRAKSGWSSSPGMLTRRNTLILSSGLGLALCSFAGGYVASIHLHSTLPEMVRAQRLQPPGDATPDVRQGVLATLQEFQAGYVARNPGELDQFMARLFDPNVDTLALGTEGATNEWARGYAPVKSFIQRDWQYWGDLRLDVEHADVWAMGDIAWVATDGAVHFARSKRPLRFTAILTREGNHWIFRQMQFQWDDSEPSDGDVLHGRTYLRLLELGRQ